MKFGLDVATDGEWSDPRLLVDLAVEAEKAGWDGFFLWDILFPDDASQPVADPWIALAAIAARTSRIRIGAMVTPVARRQPWEVAKQVASLDGLSGGRVTVGVGLGWKPAEFEQLGLDSEVRGRIARAEDTLALLDRWWRGEAASSEAASIRDVRLLPRPAQQPRPPIWLAAGLPRRAPLDRAARWDGIYLMTHNQATDAYLMPGEVAEAASYVRSKAGAAFDVAVNIEPAEDPADLDTARARARAMAGAGATWIVELTPETVEEHRSLIRRGPPR